MGGGGVIGNKSAETCSPAGGVIYKLIAWYIVSSTLATMYVSDTVGWIDSPATVKWAFVYNLHTSSSLTSHS